MITTENHITIAGYKGPANCKWTISSRKSFKLSTKTFGAHYINLVVSLATIALVIVPVVICFFFVSFTLCPPCLVCFLPICNIRPENLISII